MDVRPAAAVMIATIDPGCARTPATDPVAVVVALADPVVCELPAPTVVVTVAVAPPNVTRTGGELLLAVTVATVAP